MMVLTNWSAALLVFLSPRRSYTASFNPIHNLNAVVHTLLQKPSRHPYFQKKPDQKRITHPMAYNSRKIFTSKLAFTSLRTRDFPRARKRPDALAHVPIREVDT